jgi:ribonuclease HI
MSKEVPIQVYTDGACVGNGTAGARGGIGVWFGPDSPHNVSRPIAGPLHTNNVAELQAIEAAIHVLETLHVPAAVIHTDSMYAINALTRWAPKWATKGWRTAAGGPVANKDLIIGILAKLSGGPVAVTLNYVAGHAGIAGNEAADDLARRGAAQCDAAAFRK